MVGLLSVYALAAVGISLQFMMVVNVLITLYVIGGNALIARFIGQKRKKRAASLLYSLIFVALVLSVFVSVLGFSYSDLLYKWMGAEEMVISEGSIYFGILSLGMGLIFLDSLFSNALAAAGDTKSSFYIKLFSALMNAFLNYVLIFGHYGFEAMGIAGAAYATLISYAFNLLIYFLLLKRKNAKLQLIPIIRIIDLKRVWNIGWSAALERGLSSVSFLVFVSIITLYGTSELAGYQVGLRVEGIAFMPGFGFAIAAMALVGQNLGSNNLQRAYKMGIISGRMAYIFMGSIGVLLILYPTFFVSFFTQDQQTITVASYYLILVGLAQVPLALSFVYSAALRGAGATKITLYINITSLWLFRVLPSYIAYKVGFSVIAIFIIMNLETLLKGVVYWYFYKKKSWLCTKV